LFGFSLDRLIDFPAANMSVYSKYFHELAKDHTCRSFIHPHNPSCFKYSWEMTIGLLAKLFKLLLPFAIV
jgi:hypothetical protein